MTKTIGSLLLFLVLITPCYGQKKVEKQVRAAFDNYKSAILNDQGEEAIKHVDSRTIQYYSDILEKTKHADADEVNALSILDKIMVFSIRHRTTKAQILSFDGSSLFVYAIASGMVGKNSVANISIGDINIDNNFAKGQLISNGTSTPMYFHFYKEEGQWKIDLTSIFAVSTMAFQQVINESGEEENAYLFSLLEMLSGKKPGEEIWEKVN